MDAAVHTLAMAAGSLLVAAVAISRVGTRQPGHRGWPVWVGALGLTAASLLLVPAAGGSAPAGLGLHALLMAWPVLTLIGLRRFHARLGLPAHEAADALACAVGIVAAWWVPGLAVMGLHLYVAALIWSARLPEDVGALRVLGGCVALAGLPPALAPWTIGIDALQAQAVASALGALVMGFTTLTLMNERTERELRESRRRFRVLANTDPLTSVPNRRHFHELASRALREAGEMRPVLLLFDIDHFKLINDKLGHPAGDRALRLVGRCMQDALRAHDLAGRLGGDEFALLLDDASLTQAMGVAERIVLQLQRRSPEHRLPVLTLSFGLVQVREGEDMDEALRRADQALYEAKRQGRSRAVTAQGHEDEPVFSESQRLGLTPF